MRWSVGLSNCSNGDICMHNSIFFRLDEYAACVLPVLTVYPINLEHVFRQLLLRFLSASERDFRVQEKRTSSFQEKTPLYSKRTSSFQEKTPLTRPHHFKESIKNKTKSAGAMHNVHSFMLSNRLIGLWRQDC